MTIGEFVQEKINEYKLNDMVADHNSDYTYVKINRIDDSICAENFAKFIKEAELVSIRGNADGSISCWF